MGQIAALTVLLLIVRLTVPHRRAINVNLLAAPSKDTTVASQT